MFLLLASRPEPGDTWADLLTVHVLIPPASCFNRFLLVYLLSGLFAFYGPVWHVHPVGPQIQTLDYICGRTFAGTLTKFSSLRKLLIKLQRDKGCPKAPGCVLITNITKATSFIIISVAPHHSTPRCYIQTTTQTVSGQRLSILG